MRYIPDHPTEMDEMDRVCNLLDVHVSEYFHLMQIFQSKTSHSAGISVLL